MCVCPRRASVVLASAVCFIDEQPTASQALELLLDQGVALSAFVPIGNGDSPYEHAYRLGHERIMKILKGRARCPGLSVGFRTFLLRITEGIAFRRP